MNTEKQILIIDDDPDAVTYLKAVLRGKQYAIMTAPDGEEGLTRAKENPPDLILLDLMMPKKSGLRFLNEIRQDERLKETPIVVVSGARQATGVDMRRYLDKQPFKEEKDRTLGTAHDIKPAAYLEKPVNPRELLATVKKLI
jgi:CheY-like chemotaxis protein